MYDLAIIGAGAGGIACAKYARKLGLKSILFEKEKNTFGGTCLNKGCIPTKFFLNSSKLNKDWQDTIQQKNELVEKIKKPLLSYLEKEGVEIKWGETSFYDEHTLQTNGIKTEAKNIIIASGSSPKKLLEHKKVIFAEELFNTSGALQKVLIVGGGSAGIELASLLNNFAKNVLLIEKEEVILPFFDYRLANRLKNILEKKGININTAKTANDYNLDEFDKIILATGREPNVASLKLQNIGLALDEWGWIKTDKFMKTNLKNVYACGDINGKKFFAYTAEYQAEICINNIAGNKMEEDYTGIPECVFSLPQIAKVGILEEEAKKKNMKYKIANSNFLKFSSSYLHDDVNGFIEIVADEEDRVIGAGIISNMASELISIFSLAIKNNLTLKDLKKCTLIHPTLSEIIPLILKN